MMKNKKRNFLLIWILALALLLNVLAFVPVVAAGGRNLASENDFDYKITYKATVQEGSSTKTIEIEEDTEIPAEGFLTLNVDVNFNIPDNFELLKGDYFEIDLSGLSKIVNLPIAEEGRIVFEIEYTGGKVTESIDAAKYSVTAGPLLKVEFDQNLEELNKKTDRLGFVDLTFIKNDKGTDIREDIEVPTSKGGEKNFVVTREYSEASAISKTFIPYEPGTGKIVWIIDVNTTLDDLSGAYIIDTLPAGLTVESVKKIELKVTTSDVSTIGEPQVISDDDYTFDEETRKLQVNNLELNHKAQRVIIETSFKEGGGAVKYENEVELFDSSNGSLGKDAAEVTAGIEGISKGATSDDNSNVINWTIEYVGDGNTSEITDVLTVTSTNDTNLDYISIFFDEDSFKINGDNVGYFDPKPTVESKIGGDEDEENKGKLIITFSNLPNERGEKYTITYNTESFYSGVNAAKNYKVINSAKYGDKGPASTFENFSF